MVDGDGEEGSGVCNAATERWNENPCNGRPIPNFPVKTFYFLPRRDPHLFTCRQEGGMLRPGGTHCWSQTQSGSKRSRQVSFRLSSRFFP